MVAIESHVSEQELQDLLKEIAEIRAENQFLDPKVHSESVRINANVVRLIEIKNLVRDNLRKKPARHLSLC